MTIQVWVKGARSPNICTALVSTAAKCCCVSMCAFFLCWQTGIQPLLTPPPPPPPARPTVPTAVQSPALYGKQQNATQSVSSGQQRHQRWVADTAVWGPHQSGGGHSSLGPHQSGATSVWGPHQSGGHISLGATSTWGPQQSGGPSSLEATAVRATSVWGPHQSGGHSSLSSLGATSVWGPHQSGGHSSLGDTVV